jgi:hypothetical protein
MKARPANIRLSKRFATERKLKPKIMGRTIGDIIIVAKKAIIEAKNINDI